MQCLPDSNLTLSSRPGHLRTKTLHEFLKLCLILVKKKFDFCCVDVHASNVLPNTYLLLRYRGGFSK